MSVRGADLVAPEPESVLPFGVTPSPKMKPTTNSGLGRMLLYTRDGVMPIQAPGDPILIVGPSLVSVPVDNRLDYAMNRIFQTAQTRVASVSSHEPITIAGVEGFESLAAAEDIKSGTGITLYQVMLFQESDYLLVQGLVGNDLADEFLPEFRAMARSLEWNN
jgi:hypothetical protein